MARPFRPALGLARDWLMEQAAMPSLTIALAQIGREMDRRFELLLPVPGDARATLYRAIRHAAIGGGVRLRPLLVLATAGLFGAEDESTTRVALAIECVHVYSRIHDNLPAIDDDARPFGKPAVHAAFGEAAAVLAGDCLHAIAFELMADPLTDPDPLIRAELVLELARAAGPAGMVGGQMMDLAKERRLFDLNAVTRLQAMKTGAMIAASIECGAILGRVAPAERIGLRGYARDIGLALQIAGDLRDATQDQRRKTEVAGNVTFLSLLGPRRARAQAEILVDQAIAHLVAYGDRADLLRAIARYTLDGDA